MSQQSMCFAHHNPLIQPALHQRERDCMRHKYRCGERWRKMRWRIKWLTFIFVNDLFTKVKHTMKRSQRMRKTDPLLSFLQPEAMCNNSAIWFHKYIKPFLICMLLAGRYIDLLHLTTEKHTMNYGWIAFYTLCTEDLLGTCEELLCNLMVLTSVCFIRLLCIKAMFTQCTLTCESFKSFLSCGHRQRHAREKTACIWQGWRWGIKREGETERDQSAWELV